MFVGFLEFLGVGFCILIGLCLAGSCSRFFFSSGYRKFFLWSVFIDRGVIEVGIEGFILISFF